MPATAPGRQASEEGGGPAGVPSGQAVPLCLDCHFWKPAFLFDFMLLFYQVLFSKLLDISERLPVAFPFKRGIWWTENPWEPSYPSKCHPGAPLP